MHVFPLAFRASGNRLTSTGYSVPPRIRPHVIMFGAKFWRDASQKKDRARVKQGSWPVEQATVAGRRAYSLFLVKPQPMEDCICRGPCTGVTNVIVG